MFYLYVVLSTAVAIFSTCYLIKMSKDKDRLDYLLDYWSGEYGKVSDVLREKNNQLHQTEQERKIAQDNYLWMMEQKDKLSAENSKLLDQLDAQEKDYMYRLKGYDMSVRTHKKDLEELNRWKEEACGAKDEIQDISERVSRYAKQLDACQSANRNIVEAGEKALQEKDERIAILEKLVQNHEETNYQKRIVQSKEMETLFSEHHQIKEVLERLNKSI